MEKLEVRPPGPTILRRSRRLVTRRGPPTYSFAGDDYVANGLATWWSTEALLRSLEATTVMVAVNGDGIVGVGNIDLLGDVPIIWKLYVLPEAQGSGAGSALLAALLDRAPTGAKSVRLEYLDGNEKAAAFYAARGFTELRREPGERPGWPETVWVERPVID